MNKKFLKISIVVPANRDITILIYMIKNFIDHIPDNNDKIIATISMLLTDIGDLVNKLLPILDDKENKYDIKVVDILENIKKDMKNL